MLFKYFQWVFVVFKCRTYLSDCWFNRFNRFLFETLSLIKVAAIRVRLLCPVPIVGALSDDARLTSVCLSRTSGLSREQRGLGRLKWYRGSTHHTTRTPLLRSKGQMSTCRGGGILWRPPAQLVTVDWTLMWCTVTCIFWRLQCTVKWYFYAII